LALIHFQHRDYVAQQRGRAESQISVDRLGQWDAATGGRDVLDRDGRELGFVIQTSPTSDHIVGFSGPTNMMIAFDRRSRIIGMAVIRSGDTREHLEEIVNDRAFMQRFNGLTWREAKGASDVDAVSGATLTSHAIVEAIIHRLGGRKPPGRFPKPISIEEVRAVFPDADTLKPDPRRAPIENVLDKQQQVIGAMMRTGPLVENEIGYEGPTDTLVAFDRRLKVKTIALRHSYDNEPYVGYVRDEAGFLELFNGKSLEQLAGLDLETEGVEGVSGATMTSMAVARGLIKAAGQIRSKPKEKRPLLSVHFRDIGTAVLVVAALAIGFTSLRRRKALRIVFQLLIIVYLGLINGDMLSMALVVGWAQSGVSWQTAPGLLLLVAAALIVPLTSKRQTYCHRVCPFGAIQQLAKHRLPWQIKLKKRWATLLRAVPWLLLLWVFLVAMLHLPFNLVAIEPFNAFVFQIAGWATLAVAAVGLVASLFVPMAYCRFGCPTGAMLEFVRAKGAGDHWAWRDSLAAVTVIIGAGLLFGV